MFAKIARFRAMRPRRTGLGPEVPAYSNDNRVRARGAAAPRRIRRPALVCRWRPSVGGGLECRWYVASADGAATEEPDERWLIGRICRLLGIATADRRPAVPAIG